VNSLWGGGYERRQECNRTKCDNDKQFPNLRGIHSTPPRKMFLVEIIHNHNGKTPCFTLLYQYANSTNTFQFGQQNF
jgi:hypothetical protein